MGVDGLEDERRMGKSGRGEYLGGGAGMELEGVPWCVGQEAFADHGTQ